tara:strand:- start:449 stop:1042 length:594 start_codon:yes stop_codon:yes gene_type:complete
MKKDRDDIKKIYAYLYDKNMDHKGRHYGRQNWGEGSYDLLNSLVVSSLIDVGCGRNDFVKWAREQGIEATGIDIASPLADVVCPAHDIPFEDNKFEYLTSFDMMEHLLPEEIDDVLIEFNRVASKGFLFHISHKESQSKVRGKQLHLTVRPESWWIEKIEKFGETNTFKGLTSIKDCKGNIRKYKNVKYIHCVLGKQ